MLIDDILNIMKIETDNQFRSDCCDSVFYDSDGDIGLLEEQEYIQVLNMPEGGIFIYCRDCRKADDEAAMAWGYA